MTPVVLDDIPFEPDLDVLVKRLRIREGSRHVDDLRRIAEEAQAIARPKALYKIAFIESKGKDHIVADGITFTSRVLRVNLEQAHRIFPYVVTCGTELEEWANGMNGTLHRYWGEITNEMALRTAAHALHEHMAEQYRPGHVSTMSPGSLSDWPLQEQRPLFALLGAPEQTIGVRLTASLLMVPMKSASGIGFPTEERFESCQLCPREDCPGRRAPYDKGLYERKYQPREN